jgi:hypothetical protein
MFCCDVEDVTPVLMMVVAVAISFGMWVNRVVPKLCLMIASAEQLSY